MAIKLNLIAAVCENMGIGINGNLPWRLRQEMEYFTKLTTTTTTSGKNIVIMGRKTWDSIPDKYKPLSNRINFVLSSSSLDLTNFTDSYHFRTWSDIFTALDTKQFADKYDSVWVIGGSSIYEAAMKMPQFYRLYLTEIRKRYECDTFFPSLPDHLETAQDERVPNDVQVEKGIEFVYKVYQNTHFIS